jgi:hypothetical protein
MRRTIFNSLSAISLLVTLGSVALWIGGRHSGIVLFRFGSQTRWQLVSQYGVIQVDNQPQRVIEYNRLASIFNQIRLENERLGTEQAKLISRLYQFGDRRLERAEIDAESRQWRNFVRATTGKIARLQGSIATIPRTKLVERKMAAWVPAVGGAILPAMWVLDLCVWSRRSHVGKCRRCFYDLTGNLSGVCPECGEQTGARTTLSEGFKLYGRRL